MNSIANPSLRDFDAVRSNLEEILGQAQTALERYVTEESEDPSQLERCKQELHIARGVLEMVQLEGAALLADEISQLLQDLINKSVEADEGVIEDVTRGLLQLPNYLDYVQGGHRDEPILLLPVINDLRRIRKAELLSEGLFFRPDLDRELPIKAVSQREAESRKGELRKIRHVYQVGLLGWYKRPEHRPNLQHMGGALVNVLAITSSDRPLRLWWVGSALIEALLDRGLTRNPSIQLLLSRIDQRLKGFTERGDAAFEDEAFDELLKNLLYQVAVAECAGPRVSAVKKTFSLSELVPARKELELARESLSGPSADLLRTVAAGIEDDLSSVKDILDVYVHKQGAQVGELRPVATTLARVADTLGVLGLSSPHATLMDQIASINRMIAGEIDADPDSLLDIASALLEVESALKAVQSRRGGAGDGADIQALTSSVVQECLTDLAKVKDGIIIYIADPQEKGPLRELPELLRRIEGAMFLESLAPATPILLGFGTYLSERILSSGRVPRESELAGMADVVTGLEYFLEGIAEGQGQLPEILASMRESLERLNQVDDSLDEPISTASAPSPSGAADSLVLASDALTIEDLGGEAVSPRESGSADGLEGLQIDELSLDSLDIGEAPKAVSQPMAGGDEFTVDDLAGLDDLDLSLDEEPLSESASSANALDEISPDEVATAAAPAASETQLPEFLSGEVDQDILEIFMEEAQDERDSISRTLPQWAANPDDSDALTTARRSFHTLKGSGRLIGAKLIGEYAWAFEDLLNRVLDNTVLPGDELTQLFNDAITGLDQLVDQLLGKGSPTADIAGLMELAHWFSARDSSKPKPQLRPPLEAPEAATTSVEPKAGVDEASTTPPPVAVEAPTESVAVEPGIYEVFVEEAESHLATLDDALERARYHAASLTPSRELIRAAHTLHGSARTAGFNPIADLCGVVEAYLNALQERGHEAEMAAMEVIGRTLDTVRELIGQLEHGDAGPTPGFESALSEIRELLESARNASAAALPSATLGSEAIDLPSSDELGDLDGDNLDGLAVDQLDIPDLGGVDLESPTLDSPAPTESPLLAPAASVATPSPPMEAEAPVIALEELDSELVEMFVEEGQELLDAVENTLQTWIDNPSELSIIKELQRHLHTLKGSSRMAGLTPIGDLSHDAETLLTEVLEQRVPVHNTLFAILHRAYDRIQGQLDLVRHNQPLRADAEHKALEEALRSYPSGQAETAESAAPQSAPTQMELAAVPAGAGDSGDAKAQQELVRVRAELLDELVNSAGEVNIYYSRLGQQISFFAYSLQELDRTVARLKDQLRKMEIETEAQILYRHNQDGSRLHMEDFDPLEMDRYTNLQQLSRALGESLNDLTSIQEQLSDEVRDAETLLMQQSRVSTDLQDGLMRTRMIAFSGQAPRLRRIVRQTAQTLGKQAELVIRGGESEVDRHLLERIVGPLEHLLRNAVDHGIEMAADRVRAGKPASGTVTMEVAREGGEVVIRVSDDGAGINLDKVRRKAEAMGLISPETKMAEREVLHLLLESGFTTASKVTQISGRGVGMDVVNNEVKQLGGSVRIDSREGRGTTFTVLLPFTLAINKAILVKVEEYNYAIPLGPIEGLVRLSVEELDALYKSEHSYYEFANNRYLLQYLGTLLGTGLPHLKPEGTMKPLLMIRAAEQRAALQVDEVHGIEEVVVKPVGAQVSKVRGISGATILGDGRVVLILDVNGLMRGGARAEVTYQPAEESAAVGDRKPVILVVDDSITIRKVTARMLSRNSMEALTAKDGIDALGVLHERTPDLVLLDIEMPRMDGFELATHMRNDETLRNVPIIMISSRSGQKHRTRAEDIGINQFLGKPYQESELMESIQGLLGEAAAENVA